MNSATTERLIADHQTISTPTATLSKLPLVIARDLFGTHLIHAAARSSTGYEFASAISKEAV